MPTDSTTPDIAILIPCLNEEKTIGKVIHDFRRALPTARIIVFDNGSSDASAKIAQEAGAEVIYEHRPGKGHVVQAMFEKVASDLYIIVDGDDTYPAEEVHKLIEPIMENQADMVVGTRLQQADNGSFKAARRLGNVLITALLNLCFRTKLTDILSGYRAMSRELVENIPLLSSGFEIETELTLQALKYGYRILEIPIRYHSRPQGSESKLRSFRDGFRIVTTIVALLRDHRPMTFFPLITLILVISGLIAGFVVIRQYFELGIVGRLPLGVLAVGLILLGFLFFMTGFIVDALNRRFEEMLSLRKRQRDQRR